MSGRGTIKAGTFGGRRYREKVKKKTSQSKELEKLVKKKQKQIKTSKQIKDPKTIKYPTHFTSTAWHDEETTSFFGKARTEQKRGLSGVQGSMGGGLRKHELLRADLRGTMTPSQFKAVPQRGKDREIQMAVNTMPLRTDAQKMRELRHEAEQEQREQINPEVDFEDEETTDDEDDFEQADDDALAEMFGVEQADVAEDFNVAEAPAELAGADEFEGGELEYGTEQMGMEVGAWDEVDMASFLDDPEDDALEQPLFGMDELMGMGADADTDTDEEAEAFGKQLDEIADPLFVQNKIKNEIEKRRKARGVGSLSAPSGDRVRPPQPAEQDPRIAEQDPEWQRRYGAVKQEHRGFPRDVSGEVFKAPPPGQAEPIDYDLEENKLDFTGTAEDYGTKDLPWYHIKDPQEQALAKARQTAVSKDSEDEFISRGTQPAFQGYAQTGGSAFLGGLAPVDKHPQKRGLDFYKRKKMSKKEIKEADAKGIKHDGTKLDIGAKGMKPTEELSALEEGRVMDLRAGHIGKDVSANQPELKGGSAGGTGGKGFEGGKRSKYTEANIREGMDYKHGKKKEWDLGEGVVRDPKTRKIKTNLRGEEEMEKKKLTITGRRKAVEQAWGLSQKGMSRDDNPELRDPWAGARAVGKEAGKRASKAREAETKHKLYVKTQREKDPDYVPRGYKPFQYGAGQTEWTKKEDSRKKELTIGAKGGLAYTPEPVAYSAEGEIGGLAGAGKTALGLVASLTPPEKAEEEAKVSGQGVEGWILDKGLTKKMNKGRRLTATKTPQYLSAKMGTPAERLSYHKDPVYIWDKITNPEMNNLQGWGSEGKSLTDFKEHMKAINKADFDDPIDVDEWEKTQAPDYAPEGFNEEPEYLFDRPGFNELSKTFDKHGKDISYMSQNEM